MTVKVNASECWLQYHSIQSEQLSKWAANIVIDNESDRIVRVALEELRNGLTSMIGTSPDITKKPNSAYSIAIGIIGQSNFIDQAIADHDTNTLHDEGFMIKTIERDDQKQSIVVAAKSNRGLLYGVFHILRLFQTKSDVSALDLIENPRNRIRMLNEWDNMDGSIERGYAGRSIFFKDYKVLADSGRIREYARLIASIGINSIAINNVNVFHNETYLITDKYLSDVKKIVDTFSDYGVSVFLSLNYASPVTLGDLDTADPLDPNVREWWKKIAANIYDKIPNFGGFLVKADSENRPGPFSYDRDHADGANMLAEAVAPFGGIVIWRCFVYNHLQDWRDRSTDRARAAYDHFKPLDGRFHDNVVLQIKNGPMDFQVREPVSPLFGAMPKTNQLLELQITQEYTGQQKHLCYLVPQWKEVLDFDTYIQGEGSTVQNIVDGSLYGWKHSGMAAVSNIGDDENWTGHTLAQANLYGFGRLAWNPSLTTEQITEEWIQMTFAFEQEVNEKITSMLLKSWRIYENYNAPLGVGWMCYPHHHYGPNPDGYEYTAWGTYHFADRDGVGVDRTVETGSGYTSQYHPKNAELYNNLETCPDELLLFFHHVPYTHKLKSGKTVIQHIYDTHFEGYEQAEWLLDTWKSLEGKIDQQTYESVLERFHMQLDNAKEWRDIINTYFFRKSGIPDEQGRTIY